MYNEYHSIYNEYHNLYEEYDVKEDKKKEIDMLKVLIALIAVSASFTRFFSNEENLKNKNTLTIPYIITLIRVIIIMFSITYDWPLSMCVCITTVISILTLFYLENPIGD